MDTEAMRHAAFGLETLTPPMSADKGLAIGLAIDKLRGAADEIDGLRAALHSLDPRPAERLVDYRCALAKSTPRMEGASGMLYRLRAEWAAQIEDDAHAMLAAERPPAATVATARPAVTEAQIDAWIHESWRAEDIDSGMTSPRTRRAVRRVLTLAGIESAEKEASA